MESMYIGVDLHSASFQACALAQDGTRCWEEQFPRSADGVAAFRARCHAQSAVAIEATTPTWHFADALEGAVARIVVVDPLRTRLKAGYAAKTDRLDARRLADALRRESVVGIYYPPPAIRELRELVRYRHTLVHTRTMLIQRIRAVLLRQGISEPKRRLTTPTGRRWLTTLTLSPRAQASVRGLQGLVDTIGVTLADADTALHEIANQDPIVMALAEIPGIAQILGLTIRAEVGTIARFATPAHLASYAGLVPSVEASGGRIRRGRITRRGSPWLRWALVEAAIHGTRRSDARGRWARRLAIRKGGLKARIAIARVLCEDVWRHWRAVA